MAVAKPLQSQLELEGVTVGGRAISPPPPIQAQACLDTLPFVCCRSTPTSASDLARRSQVRQSRQNTPVHTPMLGATTGSAVQSLCL